MTAYYNENDPYAAQWLRNLIAAGHIAPGEVDERSILDVRPSDLKGFRQCHFFAGIGVWSHALRLAGWPDDREVWTGSCPCQPFSAAGKRGGVEDERHLWPEFFRLISIARPRVVFGEQVASKDGLAWLDIVSADMEGAGYAIGALDTCAASFGAPHIRQRLYFVADADCARCENTSRRPGQTQASGRQVTTPSATGYGIPLWPPEPEESWVVDESSGNVAAVRAYGNALCARQAAEFVSAFLEPGYDLVLPNENQVVACLF